jgi:hypothetical protein
MREGREVAVGLTNRDQEGLAKLDRKERKRKSVRIEGGEKAERRREIGKGGEGVTETRIEELQVGGVEETNEEMEEEGQETCAQESQIPSQMDDIEH